MTVKEEHLLGLKAAEEKYRKREQSFTKKFLLRVFGEGNPVTIGESDNRDELVRQQKENENHIIGHWESRIVDNPNQ